MSQSKGFARERELVNLLHDADFQVTRTPKSGGATQRPLPDVLASNGEVIYAFEAKASKNDRVYLSAKQLEELVYFSRGFGALARIAIRFDYENWYFFHPGNLRMTDGGNYRISKERAIAKGKSFNEIIEHNVQ